MRRTACSACGHEGLEPFLDLGYSPIADAYTASPDQPSATYPLQVAVCTGCRLVQLLDVLPQSLLFGTGYSFYSSASAPLSAYHRLYADDVLLRHGELAKRGIIEIGCNDGDFLRHFADSDHPALGIDPANGPVEAARAQGLNVIEEPFTLELARQLHDQLIQPPGLIVANHVLAHVADVSDMLAGIAHLLADDGVAYIEVQYLPDLLVNNAFDLVYHEHRNFFSLTSLESAVERWGLRIVTAQLTDRQGGSLRVKLARHDGPNMERDRIRASEDWLAGMGAYRGFQGRADRIRDRLLEIIYGLDEPVIGYGAPAKATTLLNFCHLGADRVRLVTDTTPAKQGRYIPGTGIPIKPPQELLAASETVFLLLAWNYASTIMRQETLYGDGRWLIPIPAPILL